MITINEVYKKYYADPEYNDDSKPWWEKIKVKVKYNDMILNEIFKPLVEQAGMEWGSLVRNKDTNKVGVFDVGHYNNLCDYIVFRPLDKDLIPKPNYRKIASVKNETILKLLQRDYEAYTGDIPDVNNDLVPDIRETERGSYYTITDSWILPGTLLRPGYSKDALINGVLVRTTFHSKDDADLRIAEIKEKYGEMLLRKSSLISFKNSGIYTVESIYREKDFLKAYLVN